MKNKIMPIKMQNALDLYRSAKTYLSGPDGMNNEVTMWFIAGGLLMQEISSRINKTAFGGLHQKIGVERNKKIKTIRILDVACGPGNFANHLGFIIPQLKVVGIDTNIAFLKWARKKFTNLGWKFIEGDASKIELGKKLELSGKDEYKTSFRIFEAQVKAAGLEIVKDILVWGISQNGMGSHVIILKAPR